MCLRTYPSSSFELRLLQTNGIFVYSSFQTSFCTIDIINEILEHVTDHYVIFIVIGQFACFAHQNHALFRSCFVLL